MIPAILAFVIVLAGLVIGWRDLLRFSPRRVWAISSVSFRESIRRRVLLITPLAILGAVVVSQLQHPNDELDAIRQTIQTCLFATGMVVVLLAIILASTNLPKEIESKVIYTIVTKPTTRLEIVLGKILGFARVAAVLLLIMGLFTYGYLRLRAWNLRNEVAGRLQAEPVGSPMRTSLEYYANAGLLEAKAVDQADDLQILSRPADAQDNIVLSGGESQYCVVPFKLTEEDRIAIQEAQKQGGGLVILPTMAYDWREPSAEDMEMIKAQRLQMVPSATTGPSGVLPSMAPTLPGVSSGAANPFAPTAGISVRAVPQIAVTVLDSNRSTLVSQEQLNEGKAVTLPRNDNQTATPPIAVPPDAANLMETAGEFEIAVFASTPGVVYTFGPKPTVLVVLGPQGQALKTIEPTPQRARDGRLWARRSEGSPGRSGMQLSGRAVDDPSTAVYTFDDPAISASQEKVTFEIKAGVERTGSDSDRDVLPRVSIEIRDPKTRQITARSADVRVESNQTVYVQLPRAQVPSGGFEALLRVHTPGQSLGLGLDSLQLSLGDRSFGFNLFKSLAILWMLSILVVTIALFCSTFVSWPIAVVLTVMLLLGRWMVDQIGDVGALGSSFSSAARDPIAARAMRSTVDAMQKALHAVSAVLPDISKFAAIDDISRGVNISASTFAGAAIVLLAFGLPLVALAYARLRSKEVAL